MRIGYQGFIKTMDASNINSEKLEFATLSLGKDNKVLHKIWNDKDIDILIRLRGFERKNSDDE